MSLMSVKINSVLREPLALRYVVVMEIKDRKGYFCINVGKFEAEAIDNFLQSVKPPRPMTHDLLVSLLGLPSNINCHKILIDKYIDDVYYAKIFVEIDSKEYIIDCRPSDGLAMAIRLNIPIFIDEEIIPVYSIL